MLEIIARLTGGLGNQMFQYAAAFAFTQQLNAAMSVDTSCYDYSHETNRKYMLDRFCTDAPVVTPGVASRFLYKVAGAERRGMSALASSTRFLLRMTDVKEPREYAFAPPVVPKTGRVRLLGYWQSPQYFERHADPLRAQFQLRDEPAGENRRLLELIRSTPDAVSLHVRRGDYLTARPGAVLPLGYYAQATRMIQSRLPAATYFIFSDDVAWAMKNLPLNRPAIAVDANDELTAEWDMRLMSACRHHIIANSSFSWWGAWLNPAEDKIVAAPKYWMGTPDSHYPDLYPGKWHIFDQFDSTAPSQD